MDEAPLIRIAENPIPDTLKAYFVKADDDARLRIAFYPHDDARGTVLVHPGWSEFLEKYIEVANDLHSRRFNVVLFDPRGQGYSHRLMPGDNRGLIMDFQRFQDDLETVYQTMKARFSGPHFILAHSMGGLITLQWLASGFGKDLTGSILGAPFTRLYPFRVKRIIVRSIARLGVLFGGAKRQISAATEHSMNYESNTLTQDPRRHERYKKLLLSAPEAQAGSPRFGWLNAAQNSMGLLDRPGALAKIELPVLLISADSDVTVDPTHHRILASAYANIQLVRIEGARHELLMERDDFRNLFWKAFDTYIEDRLSAALAGSV